MKLSIALTLIMLHVPAAQSKATAKSNLRGSDSHVDDIISDESVDIIRQLDVSLTNTTDEDVDCHPYDLKWDELTSQQKDAARDLSYNRHKWDNDTLPDPSAIRHDYWIDAPSGETELTNRERNAAILLGYNEGKSHPWHQNADMYVCACFVQNIHQSFAGQFIHRRLYYDFYNSPYDRVIFQDRGKTFTSTMIGPNCQQRDRTMKMSRPRPRIWDSTKRLGIPILQSPQIIWIGRISLHRSRRLQWCWATTNVRGIGKLSTTAPPCEMKKKKNERTCMFFIFGEPYFGEQEHA